ncbi:hypothetical protein [Streptomyces apocyni]|uniref:hypothetical protein n=1 Tax=Streptomyces apocyni TaxID=2654677 RepID=UPI001E4CADB4|nr:hypothetical protein [Streptomyces apocyni]
MLMLDEPTSAMDPRAEHLVINARIADRIIVLDGGRVREEGDFQTLMDLGGLFAELYKLAQDGEKSG